MAELDAHDFLQRRPYCQHAAMQYIVRYHNFKALVPADGSPIQLFNMAYRNQVNEETNVAKDYPEVVARIEKWLTEMEPTSKYLSMDI